MSFFEEDDEPTRRTRESRPRPRRATPTRSAAADQQTLLIRRAVAIGIAVVLIILLILVINACQDSQRKNSIRSWNRESQTLVTQSDNEVGRQFFDTMRQGASQSPEDLQTQVSSLRVQAETILRQAKNLGTPSELDTAQQSLLIALELRRDGLDYIGRRISTALGNEGDVADQAIEGIAGEMQAFLASDVLIRTRVTPVARAVLAKDKIDAAPVRTRGFLPGFTWLNPAFVADQLGTRLSNNGTGRQTGKTIAPGLHGDGLDSVTVNGVALQPDPAANKVSASGDLTFQVKFTNQGDNDEFDVPVQVTLQGTGKPIVGKKTVDTIAKGTSTTVNVTLSRKPAAGEVYTVNVEVKPVPGEKKTDNNKATYNVLFQ